MIYVTSSHYSVPLVRHLANVMFVFGDNQDRVGHGGQAIIRDEPNTIGVATKRHRLDFMTGNLDDVQAVVNDLRRIEGILMTRQAIVFPILQNGRTSLGCGLAALPERAPHLYNLIDDWFQNLRGEKKRVSLRLPG